MNLIDITNRYDSAMSEKQPWDSLYRAVFRMTMPNRDSFYMDENIPNNWENIRLMTNVGTAAADTFAARFQKICTNDGESFMRLSNNPFFPADDTIKQINTNLEASINFLFRRNTDSILEVGYDLVAGTSTYYKHYNYAKKYFSLVPVPIKDVSMTRAFTGEIDGYYRKVKLKREEVQSEFGLGDDVKAKINLNEKNKSDEIEIKECTIFNYDDNNWHYCVIYEEKKLLDEIDYFCDFGSLFWTRRPGAVYGIGVGVKALPEINMLNTLKYYGTFGLTFRAAPMWLASQEAMLDFDRLTMKPMEIIKVPSTGRDNPSLTPLQVGDDPNVVQWNMSQMEMNIKEIMTADTIPNQTNQRMSATEIAARSSKLDNVSNQQIMCALSMMTDCVRWLAWKLRKIEDFYPKGFDVKSYCDSLEVELVSTLSRDSQKIQSLGVMIDIFNAADPTGALTAATINKPMFADEVATLLKTNKKIIYSTQDIAKNMESMANERKNAMVEGERAKMAREIAVKKAGETNV